MKTDITVNHEVGRKGHTVKGFVLHRTEGSFMSGMSWTHNPKSQVSYHFIIDLDGIVYNTVDIKDTAWANGLVKNGVWKGLEKGVNPNLTTVSIAMSGLAKDKPTRAQVLAVCELLGELSIELNVPLTVDSIVLHREIRSDKTCPGLVPDKKVFIQGARFYQIYNRS